MPTPVPMEPMDSKLCVLLKLNLISGTATYTQTQICTIISNNQQSFDSIYNDPIQLQAARNAYLPVAQAIDVIDKEEDCG